MRPRCSRRARRLARASAQVFEMGLQARFSFGHLLDSPNVPHGALTSRPYHLNEAAISARHRVLEGDRSALGCRVAF